jgi:peptidoglycan/LPS O-acetylase OafA/YrhL
MQIRNLTGIRGFAALWVALFHFQSTTAVAALKWGPVIGGGEFGVDLFFVLSGLILAITYAPRFAMQGFSRSLFRHFVIRRFARIYPLHLATFLVMFASWEIASQTNYNFRGVVTNDWWSALSNVLMTHAWGFTKHLSWNTPSWSVSAEWFAYLAVFPLCVIILKKRSAAQAMAIAMIAWLLFVAFVFAFHGAELSQVTTDGVLRIIPEFLGGYATYRVLIESRRLPSGTISTLMGLSGIILILLLPPAALIFLLPAIVLLMIGLYRGGGLVDRVFGNSMAVFLGEISYSIYMIHVFVLIIANQLVRHMAIAPTVTNGSLLLMAEVISTIFLGYLGYCLLEAPARKALIPRLMPGSEMPAMNLDTI